MAVNEKSIWDAVVGGTKNAWNLSQVKGGWPGARKIFQAAGLGGKTSRGARSATIMASRAMSGAIVGAAVGGAWGAVSDRESIIGGAMKGAFVGGAAATSLRYFKPSIRSNKLLGDRLKPLMNISKTRLTNVAGIRENVENAWKFMSIKKNQGIRNWVVGMGLFGVTRGMMSGEDNPIGGAVGGGVAGAIQGASIYGAYRGIKSTGILNRFKV